MPDDQAQNQAQNIPSNHETADDRRWAELLADPEKTAVLERLGEEVLREYEQHEQHEQEKRWRRHQGARGVTMQTLETLQAMKARAVRCVTHHYGCDCREYELARLQAENAALRPIAEAVADGRVFFLHPHGDVLLPEHSAEWVEKAQAALADHPTPVEPPGRADSPGT